MNWSAKQYSAFENERTRPVRDLVAALPNERVARAVDLGCGPQLHRGAGRALSGCRDQRHGQSQDMIDAARKRLPGLSFELSDIAAWNPPGGYDVILANASLQWVPGHEELYPRLVGKLAPGGSLAVQTPDNMEEPAHRLAREVAADGPWAARIGAVKHPPRHSAAWYYELLAGLRPARCVAHHLSPSPGWRGGGGAMVHQHGAQAYLSAGPGRATGLPGRIPGAHRTRLSGLSDGTVLLPFPRLFIVAGAK